jgi:hypothetical protein
MTNAHRLFLEDVVASFDRVLANRRAQSKNPDKAPRLQLWERRIYEGAKTLLAPKPARARPVHAKQSEFPPEVMGDAAPKTAGQQLLKLETAK